MIKAVLELLRLRVVRLEVIEAVVPDGVESEVLFESHPDMVNIIKATRAVATDRNKEDFCLNMTSPIFVKVRFFQGSIGISASIIRLSEFY